LISDIVELIDYYIHFLEIQFGQSIKLLNIRKYFNKLLKSFDELIELVEDLGFREIEGLSFGHISNFFFGCFVGFLILSVKFNAAAEHFNNLSRISFPNIFNFSSRRYYFFSTILDHLIGYLNE
jgi:hypothetical protein